MEILFYGSFWIYSSLVAILITLYSTSIAIYYRYLFNEILKKLGNYETIEDAIKAKQRELKLLEDEKNKLIEWFNDNKKNATDLEELTKKRNQLIEEIERLQQDFAQKRNDYSNLIEKYTEKEALINAMINNITSYESQIKNLKEDLSQLDEKKKLLDSINNEIIIKTRENEKHENQLHTKVNKINDLDKEILLYTNKFNSLKEEKERIEKSINDQTKDFDRIKKSIDEKTKENNDILETIKLNQNEHNSLIKKMNGEIEEKNRIINRFKGEIMELERKSKALREEADAFNKAVNDSKAEIRSLITQDKNLKDNINTSTQILAEKEKELKKLDDIKIELDDIKIKYNNYSTQLVNIKIENNSYLAKNECLKNEIEKHNEIIKTLSGPSSTHEEPENELLKYKDMYIVPDCLTKYPRTKMNPDNEIKALEKVQKHLELSDLNFSKRVVYSFHTSLKISHIISPFTVLAGISGTGKTLLPIKYAEALGIQSLIVSVQPRWDSPQDLLGFYNYLEKKYKATELLRALINMDQNFMNQKILKYEVPQETLKIRKDMEDRLLLVLFDEMNLARIEHYFSEFLSKLEIKRQIKSKGEISIDDKVRLEINDNIMFVGTMNEDESTHSLSDKVLDRANIIRFAKPNNLSSLHNEKNIGYSEDYITTSDWRNWLKHNENDFNKKKLEKIIEDINTALDKIDRPFGYRVEQAIRYYIMNYPEIEINDNFNNALSDQIEQKILPKFRGIDINLDNSIDALGKIGEIIQQYGDETLIKAFDESKNNSSGMFNWRGVSR